jgi:TatD DNase family protein
MYFDSHCHLTDERFGDEAEACSGARPGRRREGFVLIASDEEDAAAALSLARAHDRLVHRRDPPPRRRAPRCALERVRELLAERVVAVGETGLDYYYDNAPRRGSASCFERTSSSPPNGEAGRGPRPRRRRRHHRHDPGLRPGA